MSSPNEPRRFAAAADIVPVQEVVPERGDGDGAIAVMKDGSFRQVVRAGTINFDMKSPAEREGITLAFGELVDSLKPEFPIEIVSHAKQLDTDAYVRQFDERLANDRTPPVIRGLIKAHIQHFEQSVKAQNLLQREIYVVVPYKKQGGPVTESVTTYLPFGRLISQLGKVMEKKVISKVSVTDDQVHDARQQLALRSDELIGRLYQMGVSAKRLDTKGLQRLLYEIYHPGLSQIQRNPNLDVVGLAPGFSSEALPAPRRALGPGIFGPSTFPS